MRIRNTFHLALMRFARVFIIKSRQLLKSIHPATGVAGRQPNNPLTTGSNMLNNTKFDGGNDSGSQELACL
jgi:hypothetical protein